MNICIFTASFLPEAIGPSLQLYNMCGHFSRLGHTVLVLGPDYSVEPEIYPGYKDYLGGIFPNVTVKSVPTQRNPLRPALVKYEDYRRWSPEEIIGNFIPDIIHVEDPDRIFGLQLYGMDKTVAYGNRIGIDYARKHRIPVVAYYSTIYPEVSKQAKPAHVISPYMLDKNKVYHDVYGEYDQVLCSCEDARNHLARHGIQNTSCGKFIGINETVFDSDRKNMNINASDAVKILYAGRFDGAKDIGIVLDIFGAVAGVNERGELYLAGDGKEMVKQRVKEASERDGRITYLGFLSQTELVEVYNSVDIYFSPHPAETFGMSIIEAMYRGLPVIVSNRGGPVTFVRDKENGYACESKEDYIRSLLELCGDMTLRESFGKQSRAIAYDYKGAFCAQRLVRTYEKIIQGKGERMDDIP
jgi:glycosyltransferase involved in cell wall biosynthesis